MSSCDLLDPREGPEARGPLLAWAAVQRAFALHPQDLKAELEAGRAPDAVLRAHGLVPEPAAFAERLARRGVVGVPFGSRHYPPSLRALRDAPPLLWVRGDPRLLSGPCIAIVGSRAATAYGRSVARALARALAAAGVAIVSGLALGVDAAAHEGALEGGGPTAALLACGPDRLYPAAHRGLARRILDASGAIVSELPPGTPPRRPYFPLRNRLISALSRAVVVVEARERSGSLVTARHAADQGVPVVAVPGPIDAPTSRGPHLLIRDGARILLDVSDVVEAAGLRAVGGRAAAGSRAVGGRASLGPRSGRPQAGGDPVLAAVERALADGPRSPDELARTLGLPPARLAAPLLELRLAGRLDDDRDGRVRLVPAGQGVGP